MPALLTVSSTDMADPCAKFFKPFKWLVLTHLELKLWGIGQILGENSFSVYNPLILLTDVRIIGFNDGAV